MKMGGAQYLRSFLSKRILKVVIPYILSLTLWMVYVGLTSENVNWRCYFSTTNIGDWLPNSWFVWVIIIAYFLYWVVFRTDYSLRSKLILMAIISLIYYSIGKVLGIPPYWYRSSYCIVLGMLWRYWEVEILKKLDTIFIYFTLPIICAVFFGVCQIMHLKDITPLFVCVVFSWLMYSLRYTRINKIVGFLSKISYEIYLLQCIAIKMVCDFTTSTVIAVPLIFILDIILSYLVFTLSSKIHTSICSVKCK